MNKSTSRPRHHPGCRYELLTWVAWVWRIVFDPVHLRRTLLLALVVGLLLSFFNDGEKILHGLWSAALIGKIVVNFCTPFLVANLGLLAHNSG